MNRIPRWSFLLPVLTLVAGTGCRATPDDADDDPRPKPSVVPDPDPAPPPHGAFTLGAPGGFSTKPGMPIRLRDVDSTADVVPAAPMPDPTRFHGDVFPSYPASAEPPLLAISTGQENFGIVFEPVTGDPIVALVPGRSWLAFDYTVNPTEIGTGPEPIAATITPGIANGAAGRAVFTFWIPESEIPAVADHGWGGENPSLSRDGESLGIDDSTELRGYDLHAALYANAASASGFADSTFFAGPLHMEPWLWFTLHPAAVASVTTVWQAAFSTTQPASSTMLYRSRWIPADGDAAGHWGPPEAVLDLAVEVTMDGRPGDAGPASVDGLSIAPPRSDGSIDLLFSPDGHATTDDQVRHLRFTPLAAAGANGGQVGAGAAPSNGVPAPAVLPPEGPQSRPAHVIHDGTKRTLGSRFRAGRGVGDFCSRDPVLLEEPRAPFGASSHVIDDFLVARRQEPSTAETDPVEIAASGYRVEGTGGPRFVTVADWRSDDRAATGAQVRFGTVAEYDGKLTWTAGDPTTPVFGAWSATMPYALRALSASTPLTRLQNPGQSPRGAVVAQWRFVDGDGHVVSHVVVLRH